MSYFSDFCLSKDWISFLSFSNNETARNLMTIAKPLRPAFYCLCQVLLRLFFLFSSKDASQIFVVLGTGLFLPFQTIRYPRYSQNLDGQGQSQWGQHWMFRLSPVSQWIEWISSHVVIEPPMPQALEAEGQDAGCMLPLTLVQVQGVGGGGNVHGDDNKANVVRCQALRLFRFFLMNVDIFFLLQTDDT